MLDGFWTYTLPGTTRGGTLCVRNGVACGGDNLHFFQGTASENSEGSVHATFLATRFVEAGADQAAWGKESARFAVRFEGELHQNLIIGRAQRDDLPGVVLDMILERRGDCP